MLTEIYSPGDSYVHNTKTSVKLILLFSVCTSLFVFETWIVVASVLIALAVLYRHSRISLENSFASIRPAFLILLFIFLAQLYLAGVEQAAFVVIRFIAMILAASLLTLTTPSSELIATIENGVGKFASEKTAERVSLAFSLSFRFIPQIRNTFEDVKEAQRARGLHVNWRALLTPTIVRTLKSADEIAQAIDCRNISTAHLNEQQLDHDK